MTKKSATTTLSSAYLDTIRELIMAVHERNSLLVHELTPCRGVPDDDDVQRLNVVESQIKTACQSMEEQEGRQSFGVSALIGAKDVPQEIRIAFCLLVGQVLSGEVSIHDVAHLAELSAGRDSAGLLLIHEAFRPGDAGILREHCNVSFRRCCNYGELGQPALLENAFRMLLGLEPESEFDERLRLMES